MIKRVKLLTTLIILITALLGVNNSIAAWPGLCKFYINSTTDRSQTTHSPFCITRPIYTYGIQDGIYKPISGANTYSCTVYTRPAIQLKTYYYDTDNQWHLYSNNSTTTDYTATSFATLPTLPISLPSGGCDSRCVSPQVFSDVTGKCETPPCEPPNAINPQGNCVNCPSAVFDLAGNCMPYCGHATLEEVGAIIPNTGGGFCLVPPCTAGEINNEGKCYPNCANVGKTYNKETGLCESNCSPDTVYSEAVDRCIPRCGVGEKWIEANAWTEAGCVPSTAPLPECKTINGITGVRNFEGKCTYTPLTPLDCADGYEPVGLDCVQRPIDCGEGKHQEGDNCVDNPPIPEKSDPPPAPEENPPVTPENAPTIPPETPPEEKSAKLLENIDKNIKRQIESSNADKSTLKNIADNQAKQVDNSAKGVEEAGKQTQELREQTKIEQDQAATLAGIKSEITNQTDQPVKAAIDAMGEKIADKIDEQKTDSSGPEPVTFEGGFDTEQDFSEHENASEIATEKATAAKEALPTAGVSPFIVGTTIAQDACIVGNFRGTEWRACFDYPWAVVAYQIMKAVLITVGYIQSIMLINRGMNGG